MCLIFVLFDEYENFLTMKFSRITVVSLYNVIIAHATQRQYKLTQALGLQVAPHPYPAAGDPSMKVLLLHHFDQLQTPAFNNTDRIKSNNLVT